MRGRRCNTERHQAGQCGWSGPGERADSAKVQHCMPGHKAASRGPGFSRAKICKSRTEVSARRGLGGQDMPCPDSMANMQHSESVAQNSLRRRLSRLSSDWAEHRGNFSGGKPGALQDAACRIARRPKLFGGKSSPKPGEYVPGRWEEPDGGGRQKKARPRHPRRRRK